jgi:predicted membrane metal-binding protein
MFEFRDLFQWDRFITPTIIKTFYWLVIALIALFGISGIFSGLAAMAISPFGGFIVLLSSIASVVVGIVRPRVGALVGSIRFRKLPSSLRSRACAASRRMSHAHLLNHPSRLARARTSG